MDHKMFCFQCEQTAGCKGCTGAAGVCGKKADTARLQDELTGALIGLARVAKGRENLIASSADQVVIEGLFATLTNVNFNNETILALMERVKSEKEKFVSDCPACDSGYGKTDNYDMNLVWNADEDIRCLPRSSARVYG